MQDVTSFLQIWIFNFYFTFLWAFFSAVPSSKTFAHGSCISWKRLDWSTGSEYFNYMEVHHILRCIKSHLGLHWYCMSPKILNNNFIFWTSKELLSVFNLNKNNIFGVALKSKIYFSILSQDLLGWKPGTTYKICYRFLPV